MGGDGKEEDGAFVPVRPTVNFLLVPRSSPGAPPIAPVGRPRLSPRGLSVGGVLGRVVRFQRACWPRPGSGAAAAQNVTAWRILVRRTHATAATAVDRETVAEGEGGLAAEVWDLGEVRTKEGGEGPSDAVPEPKFGVPPGP